MFVPDLVLFHDDERLAFGQLETGLRCDHTRRTRNRVECAASLVVPHYPLELALLLRTGQVSALVLQPLEERRVHVSIDQQVAVARASGSVILCLADTRV